MKTRIKRTRMTKIFVSRCCWISCRLLYFLLYLHHGRLLFLEEDYDSKTSLRTEAEARRRVNVETTTSWTFYLNCESASL